MKTTNILRNKSSVSQHFVCFKAVFLLLLFQQEQLRPEALRSTSIQSERRLMEGAGSEPWQTGSGEHFRFWIQQNRFRIMWSRRAAESFTRMSPEGFWSVCSDRKKKMFWILLHGKIRFFWVQFCWSWSLSVRLFGYFSLFVGWSFEY